MLKRNKKHIIITTLTMLLPIILGLLLWNKLPDQVPTHFDFSGTPNDYSSKIFAVFGINAFLIACHLIVAFITVADPRRKGIQDKIYRMLLWICPVVSIIMAVAIYGYCLNYNINVTLICSLLVSFLFIIIGNYLPKCKRNYTVGIRLPWTLNDTENWNATHRMAGPLWIAGGFILLILTIGGFSNPYIFMVILIVLVLVPTVYSFLFYINYKSI